MLRQIEKIKLSKNFNRSYSHLKIQYISDLHVDCKKNIPNIMAKSEYLCICGDIGTPTHVHYDQLLFDVSNKFKKIFVVPGNHEFDLSPLYDESAIIKYKPILVDLCNQYKNVYLLDNSIHQLTGSTIIAGSVLWSALDNVIKKYPMNIKYKKHIEEFNKNVDWINNILDTQQNVLMMTHFVPSIKLIEKYYLSGGSNRTDWFASNLESLIKPPIVAWICGHTHSVLDVNINDIYCGVNALGKSTVPQYKFINIIE
jgi:hypothetical protein